MGKVHPGQGANDLMSVGVYPGFSEFCFSFQKGHCDGSGTTCRIFADTATRKNVPIILNEIVMEVIIQIDMFKHYEMAVIIKLAP